MLHDILKYIQKDDPVKKTFTRLEQHAMVSIIAYPICVTDRKLESKPLRAQHCTICGVRLKRSFR